MLIDQIAYKIAQLHLTQPNMQPLELRALCLKQEQAVINHFYKNRTFDIYEEIAKVCPSQADLRLLPN